jgi:hypothetical protein
MTSEPSLAQIVRYAKQILVHSYEAAIFFNPGSSSASVRTSFLTPSNAKEYFSELSRGFCAFEYTIVSTTPRTIQ